MTDVPTKPGSRVYASYAYCPDRLIWTLSANDGLWYDKHGCRRKWEQLIDPIDTFPEGE